MENWSLHIKEKIHAELSGIKEKDLRFYRIDEFFRNIERINTFSEECPICNLFKNDVENMSGKINEAINVPGKDRREYDRLISRLSGHMKKIHKFFPPYYFTYLHSFIGIVAGLAAGISGSLFFPSTNWLILFITLATGLLAGQITGNKKDRLIRNNKRLM